MTGIWLNLKGKVTEASAEMSKIIIGEAAYVWAGPDYYQLPTFICSSDSKETEIRPHTIL